MWNLIRCECLRFRKWALGLAALHLLLLGYLYINGALQPSDSDIANSAAILYALLGLGFGLVQIGGYRRPSQWVFLMHRPLAPARIWLALVAGALTLLSVAIIAPLYLTLLGADLSGAQDLDLRVYLLPLFLFGLAFCGYLCGTFILLSSSRVALVVLALPTLFMTREAGLWIFIPQLAVTGLLLWLNRCAFKPDRQARLKSPTALVPTALAIQWGLYCALYIATSLGYQFGLMAIRQHPNYNPAPDTTRAITAMADSAAMQYAFGNQAPPMLEQELAIAAVHRAAPQWNHFPFHQQLPFADTDHFLFDKARNIRWHFSHDRMLFKGINVRSGADAGWMGRRGAVYPFSQNLASGEYFRGIPQILDSTTLVMPRAIYRVDFDNRRLEMRYSLEPQEHFRSGIQVEGKMAIAFSDRKLYFFDAFDVQNGHGPLQADAVVPLPQTRVNLRWVYAAELADGFALTFVCGNYGREGWDPASPAYLISGLLPLGGEFAVTRTRTLQPIYPLWFRYKEYLISPLFAYLNRATRSAIEPQSENSVALQELIARPLPQKISTAMLVMALFCALITALLARRTRLSLPGRAAWILCNALTGLPGLLSFLFLTDRHSATVQKPAQGIREVQPA
ncbi:hypothetical protein [Microbulbifer sp. SAOS-129_SWC]|uniref:hypothetical protein n=1 Tax=Microbulbifer sp. SAOS-129_SWC TaxID=3145235 RepID=UPI003217E39C